MTIIVFGVVTLIPTIVFLGIVFLIMAVILGKKPDSKQPPHPPDEPLANMRTVGLGLSNLAYRSSVYNAKSPDDSSSDNASQ